MTDERVELIVEMLDTWSGKLTWDLLIEEIGRRTSITYSRFTLLEYPRVASAFKLRKEALRAKEGRPAATPRDERLRAALERVERQRATIERLEVENRQLLEQFMVWQHNAHRRGVTIAMLNQPLPKPSREQTRGSVERKG